jgi:murein DD-endopeptidase MepM/ murein hydrolase activator NlpD
MSARTLKVQAPHQKGDDVRLWQETLRQVFARWKVDHPLRVDGDYGVATRDATATVLFGLGISRAEMEQGVTPELRIKVRSVLKGHQNDQRTDAEKERSRKRAGWRKKLRERWNVSVKVAVPLAKITGDSWGWNPSHDGIDLLCPEGTPALAIVRSRVIDVRSGGWWGKGAPSAAVAARGDGIVQIEALETVGPIRKGTHFGYGHCEKATVAVGEIVKAGQMIGRAGFANAGHIHFMQNDGSTSKGIGTTDPRRALDFARKHG